MLPNMLPATAYLQHTWHYVEEFTRLHLSRGACNWSDRLPGGPNFQSEVGVNYVSQKASSVTHRPWRPYWKTNPIQSQDRYQELSNDFLCNLPLNATVYICSKKLLRGINIVLITFPTSYYWHPHQYIVLYSIFIIWISNYVLLTGFIIPYRAYNALHAEPHLAGAQCCFQCSSEYCLDSHRETFNMDFLSICQRFGARVQAKGEIGSKWEVLK